MKRVIISLLLLITIVIAILASQQCGLFGVMGAIPVSSFLGEIFRKKLELD